MLRKTGERQVGVDLNEIRDDHKKRYQWASSFLDPSWTVIDAGCGIGYGSNILSSNCNEVLAYDISTDAINYAKRFWSNDKVIFEIADVQFLEEKRLIDAIVAFEVVEHLVAPEIFLANIQNILNLNAKLYISVPNERQIPHTPHLNPFHIQHFTLEEITELLNKYGFEVTKIGYQNEEDITDIAGNFIIIEAQLIEKNEITNEKLFVLFQKAVSKSNNIIVERAELLHKSKKDIEFLKNEIKKITFNKASDANKPLDSNLYVLFLEISKRINELELNNKIPYEVELSLEKLKKELEEKNFIVHELKIDMKFLNFEKEKLEEKLKESENGQHLLLAEVDAKEIETIELKKELQDREEKLKESEDSQRLLSEMKTEFEKKIKKLLDEVNNSLASAQAFAEENRILKDTNEKLGVLLQETQENQTLNSHGVNIKKEPPSLQYLIKKLKYHKFYLPFFYKAVRNSVGLKKSKKSKK